MPVGGALAQSAVHAARWLRKGLRGREEMKRGREAGVKAHALPRAQASEHRARADEVRIPKGQTGRSRGAGAAERKAPRLTAPRGELCMAAESFQLPGTPTDSADAVWLGAQADE
jgi:hypothetical protein